MMLTVSNTQEKATRVYDDLQLLLAERKDISWADGEARVDDAFDTLDEIFSLLARSTQ